MYLLVTGTCISCSVNVGDQIGGVMWCSSGKIFGFCFYDGLWSGRIKCLTFDIIMAHLEAGKYHRQVQQWEPF